MKNRKLEDIIQVYQMMTEKQLEDECYELVNLCFAMLEATESDSITEYISPNLAIKISLEQFKDGNKIEH